MSRGYIFDLLAAQRQKRAKKSPPPISNSSHSTSLLQDSVHIHVKCSRRCLCSSQIPWHLPLCHIGLCICYCRSLNPVLLQPCKVVLILSYTRDSHLILLILPCNLILLPIILFVTNKYSYFEGVLSVPSYTFIQKKPFYASVLP